MKEANPNEEIAFYDSVTGLPLFVAPKGRSFDEWAQESLIHGDGSHFACILRLPTSETVNM